MSHTLVRKVILFLFSMNLCLTSYAASDTDGIRDYTISLFKNNARLVNAFGNELSQDNFTKENVKITTKPDGSLEEIYTFRMDGAKIDDNVLITYYGINNQLYLLNVSSRTDEGELEKIFVDITLSSSVFSDEEIATLSFPQSLSFMLDRVEKQFGSLTIRRSFTTNDFMKATVLNIQNKPCTILEYSEGYRPGNNLMFRASGQCQTRDIVMKMFSSYFTGFDGFKQEIAWDQLKRIEDGQFVY